MVINYLNFDPETILQHPMAPPRLHCTIVGVTNKERWDYEVSTGGSPGEAKTLISVTLDDRGRPWAVGEEIGLSVARQEPFRDEALAVIPALLKIAWEIKETGLSETEARKLYMGREVNPEQV